MTDSAIGEPDLDTDRVLLETRDAAVHYGGIKAVDGVDIRITAGKVFGILGPNGSGKSTLLAAITRHTPLTRGDVIFDGSSYRRDRPHEVARRRISRTFQTVRLLDDLTVLENIRLATDVNPIDAKPSKRERAEQVERAIALTGIAGMDGFRPDKLSYGWQRRVEIARALAGNPRLLLLDEPTAGMSRTEKDDISRLLLELRDEGVTQMLVEHDVQMMVDTCDYLYAMNFGALIAQGKPREVVRDPAVREAYLGKNWSEDHA